MKKWFAKSFTAPETYRNLSDCFFYACKCQLLDLPAYSPDLPAYSPDKRWKMHLGDQSQRRPTFRARKNLCRNSSRNHKAPWQTACRERGHGRLPLPSRQPWTWKLLGRFGQGHDVHGGRAGGGGCRDSVRAHPSGGGCQRCDCEGSLWYGLLDFGWEWENFGKDKEKILGDCGRGGGWTRLRLRAGLQPPRKCPQPKEEAPLVALSQPRPTHKAGTICVEGWKNFDPINH